MVETETRQKFKQLWGILKWKKTQEGLFVPDSFQMPANRGNIPRYSLKISFEEELAIKILRSRGVDF